MKSVADPRRRLFLMITTFLGQKVHCLGMILSDDLFFLEITAFLKQTVHYLETISNDDLFFRNYCIFRTNSVLLGNDFK